MKKVCCLFIIPIISFTLFGCDNKSHESPSLSSIEVSYSGLKNLVILIGDGMGPNQIASGELVYGKKYDFTSWNISYSDTYSYQSFVDDYVEITDSAAGGTAIATGVVTINGYVGKDKDGNDLATILDYAKSMGKSIGVVSNDIITGATPSDFSGHSLNRSNTQEIIDTQITSNVDLFIGQFSEDIENRKKDIIKGGYSYYSSYDEVKDISDSSKAWCQFNFEENGGSVSLKNATEVATNYLSKNDNGYVLMVEQAYIDKYSHNNNFEGMVKAVDSLNDTVDYVKSACKGETGIIISADHETGNLAVSKEQKYSNQYEDVYYQYYSSSHSGIYVPVYVYGFDVDFKEFSYYNDANLIKNKDIFNMALYAITGSK